MVEEYARSRRNIIEKEIEPTVREIIEEEVPSICEAQINKGFNNNQLNSGISQIKPI